MKIPIRELMKVHFYAEAGTESEIAIERIAFNCVCDIVGASDCVSTSYLKVTQTTFSWHRLTKQRRACKSYKKYESEQLFHKHTPRSAR